jgi:hydroxymethylpyrimidine/phosphomethylpyrimidine kinase
MLANAEIVRAVAASVRDRGIEALVVDPIMLASSGEHLLDGDGTVALVRELLPLAFLTTPNVREAEVIAGCIILSWEDARRAAARIVELGARSVVITGGDFGDGPSATDLYFDGHQYREFTAARVHSTSTHGTGCTFSAAVTAGLAKGMQRMDAIALAKSYVALAMQHAYPIGRGSGPLHHFYRYWQPMGEKYRPGVGTH